MSAPRIPIPRADAATTKRNQARHPQGWDGVSRCLVCDAPIKDGSRVRMLRVVNGGGYAASNEESARLDEGRVSEPGDCGGWPIGPECARKHPELAEYWSDWKRY